MSEIDFAKLSQADAALLQHGLKALGFYAGTTRGEPGAKTLDAYARYRQSLVAVSKPEGASLLTARLIAILSAEDGVRESPKNSNRGKRVEEYQRATWHEGTGWAWCAAFISWGLMRLDAESTLPFALPREPGAWAFEAWAKKQGITLMKPRKAIRAGDIVMFTFSHIGLAIADEAGGSVRTVEGNTDSSGGREGGGVYIQSRKVSLIRSHIRLFQ